MKYNILFQGMYLNFFLKMRHVCSWIKKTNTKFLFDVTEMQITY